MVNGQNIITVMIAVMVSAVIVFLMLKTIKYFVFEVEKRLLPPEAREFYEEMKKKRREPFKAVF